MYEDQIRAEAAAVVDLGVEIEVAGRVIRVLESCHSRWMFDPERGRFRRVPREGRIEVALPEREWTRYYQLEVDPSTGGFAVSLDEDGTHFLRARFHGHGCPCARRDPTSEQSMATPGTQKPRTAAR